MAIKLDKADRAFSLYIRTRDKWTCQSCKKQYPPNSQGLDCSHYWGRRMESVRFDPANCDTLCTYCHFRWGRDYRSEYTEFKKKQLGETAYKMLEITAKTPMWKLGRKKDRKLEYIKAMALLKEVE